MPNKSFKNTWLGTTTIKNDQNDLGTQITDNWNQTVKLTGDQTIAGNKTFNETTKKNIVYSLNDNGWNTILDRSLPTNTTWAKGIGQTNLTLPNNFWQNNKWYEIVITIKKGDFSRKVYIKTQKLDGENWIMSNNIIFNSDLVNANRSEFYVIIGTANTGTDWRIIQLSGIIATAIDKIVVKVRKME